MFIRSDQYSSIFQPGFPDISLKRLSAVDPRVGRPGAIRADMGEGTIAYQPGDDMRAR